MNLTTAQRHEIRRWTQANERARRAYEAEPIASDLPGVGRDRCGWGECTRPEHDDGLCTRHLKAQRKRDEKQGAA